MTDDTATLLAVDLGATSGRVMAGRVGPGTLELEQLSRFTNEAVRTPDGLQTDLLSLHAGITAGLAQAGRRGLAPRSIAVDSWAVDYGLLRGGRLLAQPMHYRDERCERGMERVHRSVPFAELYARNGLQLLPFNTLYQLAAEQDEGLLDVADRMLMVPDLVAYWLGADPVHEATNASTTGLLTLATPPVWDDALIERLGYPRSLFGDVVQPGTRTGSLSAGVAARTGLPGGTSLVAVGSHDTASAVVAVPMTTGRAAWVSCGTWGLVGLELPAPVVTDEARDAGFTNERGVDGTTRFLHNVMGLWVLSSALREWYPDGGATQLPILLEQAAGRTGALPVFDVDHASLMAPGAMTPRVAALLRAQGDPVPEQPVDWVACIVDSLALAMAQAVRTACRLADQDVDVVHVVGGGALNTLLCQRLADHVGLPVLAGPVEATAIGNLLVQARTAGVLQGDLGVLRALVADTHPPTRLLPR